jgi:hypothetical protein
MQQGCQAPYPGIRQISKCVFNTVKYYRVCSTPYNASVYLRGAECEGVDWIHLVHDGDELWALLTAAANLRLPFY